MIVNKTSIDFGIISIQDTSQSTFAITNDEASSLVVSNIIVTDIAFSVSETNFSISPGENKVITATFSPVTLSAFSESLTIQSSSGNEPIALLGESVSAGIYVNKSSINFGAVTAKSTKIETVLVSNISSEDVDLLLSSVITTNVAFRETVDSFRIVKGEALQIPITFLPLFNAPYTGQLQISSNDTSLPVVSVDLSGTGVSAPNISATTSLLNFGSVGIGQTVTKTFRIQNTGDLNLTITHITSNNAAFSVSPINGTVQPNKFLTVSVVFEPENTQTIRGKLTILSNDTDTPSLSIDLQGTGESATIVISPSSLNFGNVTTGQTSSKEVTLYSNSSIPLVISTIDVVGSTKFSIDEVLPFTVTSSKIINVNFNPTELGLSEAVVNIGSNDINNPTISVSARGSGVNPNIAIQPNSLDFLDVAVGTTSTLSVTLMNSGQGTLVISNVISTNPVFTVDSSNFEIEPGFSKSISIIFSPIVEGNINSTITFFSNDPNTPNIALAVQGYGAYPSISLSPTTIDFGQTVVNNTKTQSVSVINSGRAPLNVSISSNSSLFVVSVLNLTVQKNSTQSFDVAFTPTSSGSVSGVISLVTNDPTNSVFNFNVSGNGATSPKIIVTPETLTFSDVAMGSTQTLDLAVSNQGSELLAFTTNVSNPVRPGRPDTFSVQPTSGALAATHSLTLSVTFNPNDPEQLTGTLKILSNDVSEPELEIPLRGSGKPAVLSWDKINTAQWIPTEIYTIATSLTNIVDPMISALELTNQILDIVKLFIIDISDAITILLEQIKKTIDDFINDLAATGLYALYVLPGKSGVTPYTYPQYFRDLPKSSFNIFDPNNPSWFDSVKGGYSSFVSKVVESFDDPADGRRPQFSDDAMVGAYAMMFDSGTVGPDDVAKFIRSIQKLMKLFRNKFKVAFEPPSNVSAFAGNQQVKVTFSPSSSVLPKEYFIFRSEVQGGDIVTYEYNGKVYPCHDENGNPVRSYELIGVTNVVKQLSDILGIGEDDAETILGEAGYAAKSLATTVLNGDPFRLVYEDTTVSNDKTYYYIVASGYTTIVNFNYSQIKNVLSSDFDKKIVSTVDPETMQPVEIEINPKTVAQTKIMALGSLSAEVSAKPVNASFEVFGGLARCRNFRCGFNQDVTESHRISGAEAPDFIIIANTPISGSVRIKVTRNGSDFIANPASYRVDYTPKVKEDGVKSYQGTTSKIFIKSRYYYKSNDILTITYKFQKDLKTAKKLENAVLDQNQTFLTSKKPIDSTAVRVTYNGVELLSSDIMVLNDKDGRIKVNKIPGTRVIVDYVYYPDFDTKDYFKCVRPEYSRYFFDITKCDAGSTLCTGYDNANCYYNDGSKCTNTEKSERKVLTRGGFISEDMPFNLFWDPISCQNGMMQQRCDGYSKTFPRYSPKTWPDWSSVRLSALGLFPKIEEIMKIMSNLLDSLLAGTEKMSTAIENFIDLLQKKIDSLKNLLETIKAFLVTITEDFVIPDLYFLRIPYARGGNEYLKTSIQNSIGGPPGDPTAYTAGVVLVYGTPGLGNALQLFFG